MQIQYYCLVQNGSVVQGPCQLPQHWGDQTTFNLLPAAEIAAAGWWPYSEQPVPTYNPQTQTLTSAKVVDAIAQTVTLNYLAIDLPAAQQWSNYQYQVQEALHKTDLTVNRITEGVSLGTCALTNADVKDYMNYRRSLRAILSQQQPATVPTVLPTEPPYLQGT